MITEDKIKEFTSQFSEFKKLEIYQERQNQKLIAPLFKEIIWETLKNEKIENEHLTGLIQMFGWRCKPDNFRKYLELCVQDKVLCEKLIAQKTNTIQRGFTAIGKTAIEKLSNTELKKIRNFLLNAFSVKSVEEAVILCRDFESLNIPQVKQGIFSPWLYYINPTIFPMVNNSHHNFKKWYGVSKEYTDSIQEYHQFKDAVNEYDFAGIDYFAHILTKEGELNYRKYLELNGKSIYKISHGIFVKNFKDSGVWELLEANRWICMHEETGKRQGEKFVSELQIGDFVYLCYGGEEVSFIGQIKSDANSLPKEILQMFNAAEEPWIYREVEILFEPKNQWLNVEMKQHRGAYMPSGNTTFAKLPEQDLEWINSVLFIPYYNVEVLGEELIDEEESEMKELISNLSTMNDFKNSILYGPPGTGKTYKLLEYVTEWDLLDENKENLQYESFLRDLTWWQLVALVLMELKISKVAQILEHPMIKDKFDISNILNKPQRIWSTLQNHTVDDCENVKYQNRHGVQLFYKEPDSTWRLDNADQAKIELDEVIVQLEEIRSQGKKTAKRNYSFITCHQSLSYEDFIEGIKPVLKKNEAGGEEDRELEYELKKGVFYLACEKAAQLAGFNNLEECLLDDKKSREQKFKKAHEDNKKYVVFLDEINRCNVSSVFGELITLIEDDKRLGAENEMTDIILPYSQKHFGVPANLYIVGTMNTADRSVEALDTALRRRFSFVPMAPKPEMLIKQAGQVNLQILLTTLNDRLIVLKDSDHTIGHAWLWEVDSIEKLKVAFANKILPLLQEYFYNDYEKLGLVLGDAFFELPHKRVAGNEFALFSGSNGLSGQYKNKYIYKLKNAEDLSEADFLTLTQAPVVNED